MESVARCFSEEQFQEVCAELQQPVLAGADWELLVNASGLSVYRLLDKQTGLYEYKVFGILKDCLPALLMDVYMDLDYRKQWDQYVKEICEKECNGETVTYWEVKYPFPMSNRDYVYIRQRRDLDVDGRKFYVVLAESICLPEFPEKSGVIRVNQYKQKLAIVLQRNIIDKESKKSQALESSIWKSPQCSSRPQIGKLETLEEAAFHFLRF
ncbi:PREDICTED: phosphatidylcholine transfer protein-like [Chinchilla lanigera]|uniref:phosphatidylcholine transfer protein-like n=1 Tax=Chinchilla lanigera TaxID=34839 RepID=UPI0006978765|nr:PREDICTED: phosphatidylcholine transfer protein-like [Chinchilla lanigera]